MVEKRKHMGLLGGMLLALVGLFRFREGKAGRSRRMTRLNFSTSTQRMGLRFTARLRDVWRFRWLKLRR